MARTYKPNTPFTVKMILLIPSYSTVKGVRVPVYPEPDAENLPYFFASFRSFGGSEMTINDVYTVVNTAIIETWYRPDITANCRVYVVSTGDTYEIKGDPENIEMRNRWLKFRVEKIGGAA